MVEIGNCLSLDSLSGVDDEHSALASSYRPADLVGKIDVARCVDQVEQVGLTIFGVSVHHGSCLCKNCYASLSFYCESVKYLCFTLFQLLYCVRHLKHAVCQCRLTMVDMSNDRKVADALSRDRRQQGLVNHYFLLFACSSA